MRRTSRLLIRKTRREPASNQFHLNNRIAHIKQALAVIETGGAKASIQLSLTEQKAKPKQ